jgi:hypothetical protein
MADIKNKNELKRRIELFLDELDYSINEKFCREIMQLMREFIGHASHQLDNKNRKIVSLQRKLKEQEKAEKNGLLLKLPCKVGSTVYVLAECKNIKDILDGTTYDNATGYYCPYELYDNCPHVCDECDEAQDKTAVFEDTVAGFIYEYGMLVIYTKFTGVSSQLGDYIFLSKEEAEKALVEREL